MAPLREYLCTYCDHHFEEFISSTDPDVYRTHLCRCGSTAEVLPSAIGGYNGVSLSGVRKKNSGAMGSKKSFTGNKDGAQMSFEFSDEGPYTQDGIDGKDFE